MNRRASRPASALACEPLEGRKLLSGGFHPSPAAAARSEAMAAAAHLKADFNRVVADIRTMQAGSHMTPAEEIAVSMDLFTIQDVTAPPSGTKTLANATYDALYRMDYALIEAGMGSQGWADKKSALAADFAALGYSVPPAVLDQTMADLEAMARSVGVSVAENTKYWNDEKVVMTDLAANPAVRQTMDPFYYLSGHFSGFVVGAGRAHIPASGPFGLLTPAFGNPSGGWIVSLL